MDSIVMRTSHANACERHIIVMRTHSLAIVYRSAWPAVFLNPSRVWTKPSSTLFEPGPPAVRPSEMSMSTGSSTSPSSIFRCAQISLPFGVSVSQTSCFMRVSPGLTLRGGVFGSACW